MSKLTKPPQPSFNSRSARTEPISIVFLVLIWFCYLAFLRQCLTIYLADVDYEKAGDFLNELEFEKAQYRITKALEKNNQEPAYYRRSAQISILQSSFLSQAEKTRLKTLALDNMLIAQNLNPQNLVTLKSLVPLYYYLALDDPFSDITTGKSPDLDNAFVGISHAFLESLKQNYAHDAGVVSLVANYERELKLEKEYLESRELVRKLRPDLLEWYASFK